MTRSAPTAQDRGGVQSLLQLCSRFTQINPKRLLLLPGVFWLLFFVCLPLLGIIILSFCSRSSYGEIQTPLSFSNYWRLLGFGILGFNPIHVKIFIRTVGLSALSTMLCIILGTPLAFWIARHNKRIRNTLLVLVTIPLWTNLMIRTYAWQIILAPNSILSDLARYIGAIDRGEGLYPGTGATLVGLFFDYLPFFVLPLYASVERIDWRIWEAAIDLGARRWRAFRHGILPQIMPGLATAITLVFVPALGQFVIPDLLGGSIAILTGNSIAQQFGASRDWPFGAAIASTQIVIVFIFLAYLRRHAIDKD